MGCSRPEEENPTTVTRKVDITVIGEDEKKLDPEGVYVESSRAELISKIYDVESSMVEAASLSFHNAVAQLRLLNPGFELNVKGLDEDKEVCDGHILPPLPEGEN
ncbi:hypothetical protein A2U01_0029817 [Trifolium medium]|uniref:Uncharacterized protein n=1 Tax=Trifolium medium TaxID=97028 RepID=A0A392P9J1_9FABA|nr:hypothetical protein [Trifolium medium]